MPPRVEPKRMNIVPGIWHPMRFWIRPGAGVPYLVDLTHFEGGRLPVTDYSATGSSWPSNAYWRPNFARCFAEILCDEAPKRGTFRVWEHAFNVFGHFLAQIDPDEHIQLTRDLTDAHGTLLKRFTKLNRSSAYGNIKTLLFRMRSDDGLPPLVWPQASQAEEEDPRRDLESAALRRLFQAFKAEARCVKGMFLEGTALAAAGGDRRGLDDDSWVTRENRAWLIAELTKSWLPTADEAVQAGAGRLFDERLFGVVHDGPRHLPRTFAGLERHVFVDGLRWFHPGFEDVADFLWLFVMTTGWNLGTALAIDVTDDACFKEHPLKPDYWVISAFKARSGSRQFAVSRAKPEWHPYRLLRYVIERTAVLRATVRRDLARLVAADDGTPRASREIALLQERVRSPWLHITTEAAQVLSITGDDASRLTVVARRVARDYGLLERHPDLATFSFRDARRSWIEFAYEHSDHDVETAKAASQHKTASTLKNYLGSRRFRSASQERWRSVLDAAFVDIVADRPLDATTLRLRLEKGEITAEQQERLHDYRKRTRLGMGCLDPRNPPKKVAPAHAVGEPCAVQRCTGCAHGVVFEDSLPHLARAYAELQHMHAGIPLASWKGSSFEAELASLESTLKAFDAAKVTAAVEAWTVKFAEKRAVPRDTYPDA